MTEIYGRKSMLEGLMSFWSSHLTTGLLMVRFIAHVQGVPMAPRGYGAWYMHI
jgi:hypothetical protein